MSDTILSGDFTIYYLDENRQKRIVYSGSTSTYTMNQLQSALQDHFDEQLQMDDGTPMSAQTPVEYTIGIIDAGDLDPWYISYESLEYLNGGALRTASWTRSVGSNTGIVVAPVTAAGNNITATDAGLDISHADGDAGTLLDVIKVGDTNDYIVIRPDSFGTADNFDSTSGNLVVNAHTAVQAAASTTGEQIWANLYSLGTIEADSHIYLYKGEAAADADRVRIYSIVDQTQDWWSDGHIDICVPIRDFKTAANPIIDEGYVSVFIRKYTTLYDNFEVANSTTSGGRNPIPLATGPDLDNTTGYKSIVLSGASGNWGTGDEIEGGTSGARAIITQVTGSNPSPTLYYYLIDDPLTDFSGTETVTNNDDTGSGSKTAAAPADQGPALSTWFTSNTPPTATYANTTVDIDDDGTAEGYGITVDCQSNPVTEVYEWMKYTFRRGNTSTTNSDNIACERYIGANVYLEYTGSVSGGTISEGDDVEQATTLATGVVISHDTTNKEILLRDTRGTFNTTNTVTSQDNSGAITPDAAAAAFAPKKQSPLGTLAGGTLFLARGVVLANWIGADENSFQLTDSAGNIRERPVAISLTVTNLVGTDESTITDDRVAVFRLTGSGGSIDKTEYSASGGETPGAATLVVDSSITTDTPGKTTGGALRIRDADDNNQEYRIRYSSWTSSTFTLANTTGTADAGTDANTIIDAAVNFSTAAKRGDLIWNSTRTDYAYITSVDDANTIQLDRNITGQTTGDSYEINAVPITMNTADDVYIPLIDEYADSTSASVSIVYASPIDFRVKVRNVANSTPIIPFVTDGSTSGTDQSVATIRTTDAIYTP